MRKCHLLLAILSVFILLTACGKTEEAQAVDDMILSIDEISEDNEAEIIEAESAYNKLTEKEQKSLDNYDLLIEARNTYDRLRAGTVIAAIDDIGAIDENSGQVLDEVNTLYGSLSDSQKDLVENYSDLTSAEETYGDFQADQVEKLIRAIGEVSLSETCEAAIETAEEAYKNLKDTIKPRVSNYRMLVEAREAFDNLCPLQLNSYRMVKNIIGYPDFSINAKNVSNKIIKEFSLRIFAYDEDGVPVQVRFDNYTSLLSYTAALKPGETTNMNRYWTLYGTYSDMQQMVVIVDEIEFYDDTTWSNPQSDTLYVKYNENLLEVDDENVLERK